MSVRFTAIAIALVGFAALAAPASAAVSHSSDGAIVVAQRDEMRGGDRDRMGGDHDRMRGERHMDRRVIVRHGLEHCRVTIVRERTRHGMVERRIRRCR
ncbi:MAG: hypothetical protein JWL62_2638 [Hyphomicrobiales bacterium]|nr:hypothetical protein [Hyphomicrobiales bacterium]